MADSGSGSKFSADDMATLQRELRMRRAALDAPMPEHRQGEGNAIRLRRSDAVREVEAELRFRKDHKQSRSPSSPGGVVSPIKLAGDAVREYFTRKNITPRPRYETVRIDLTWEHGGRKYLGIYSAATQSLQVWVEVPPSTEGASPLSGSHYMPVV